MIINLSSIHSVFVGFSTAFNKAFTETPVTWPNIAMKAQSDGREETYAWLGKFARMRQWVGDRVVRGLAAHGYTIKNLVFEDTVSVPRDDIADDKIGVFAPMFADMGRNAKIHPEELIYELLARGFTATCYDGQYFFDEDHPVGDGEQPPVAVSNVQSGSGPAWFLLDCSRMVKPLIFQEREPYKFVRKDGETDDNVFMRREFLYGVDARVNAGFGLWQLAFGSKADLTPENYETARAAMQSLKGDNGRPLGVNPTHLVVPTALEGAARRLLKNGTRVITVDGTPVPLANEWVESAELIVTPYL